MRWCLTQEECLGMDWFRHLQLRWKLLIMVMPVVLVPLLLMAFLISNISMELAYEGITRASRADLQHMSDFSLDLIDEHHRQYEVYQQEKELAVRQKLHEIVDLAYTLVENNYQQFVAERLPLESVKQAARNGLKFVSVGEGGYLTVMDSSGQLLVHPVAEGKNINNSQDENGRYFIREMCTKAVQSVPGQVLYTKYPWKNILLGDRSARQKVVAYRYFPEWDWIISAGSYLDEIYDNKAFENRAFAELKQRLREKKVGKTGFIYAAECDGKLMIHPFNEGDSITTWLDSQGLDTFEEACEKKGDAVWLQSMQQRGQDLEPRARITRLEYFRPWDWIVFVEAYEDELFGTADVTKKLILGSVVFLSFLVSAIAGMLTFYVAGRFTYPIYVMTEEIARAKGSRLVKKIPVPDAEELKKLAIAFNTMSELIQHEKALEEKLARMEKMASIGVLSSGVAHEINNPMGVILGYACHLENKLDKNDPNYHFVQEIKEESKRCVKIVQNLLDYARAPNLNRKPVDVNMLLDQTVEFAGGHADFGNINIVKDFSTKIGIIEVDADQLRQVIINLMLNAAAAMKSGGDLVITTRKKNGMLEIGVKDNGTGIAPEHLKEVYEPFFTTKKKGTGLGLAISRQIVEAHLGAMEIESVVGSGTKVIVKIPLR
jgi:two-component system NtrC family sensor kinase